MISLPLALSCSHTSFEANDYSSKLIEELEAFNSQMEEANPGTKGFGRICGIVGADFMAGYDGAIAGAKIGFKVGMVCGGKGLEGALIGGGSMGLICGIGGSYLAWYGTKASSDTNLDSSKLMIMAERSIVNVDEVRTDVNEDVIGTEKLILPQRSIDVGILHNYILSSMIDEKELSVKESRFDNSSLEHSIFYNDEFIENADNYIQTIENNGVSISQNSIPDKVMNLYQSIFNTCSDSYDDIVTCINNYYSIVEQSAELTDEEKQSIYIGLSVSLYSLNFWNAYGEFPQN